MRNIIIFIFICIVWGCSEEKENFETPINNRYNLQKGEEGSFQREIYDFYNNYGSIILFNADSSNFKYNFATKNEIHIVNEIPNEENLKNALNVFEEIFIDIFPKDFLKKNLPFNIIFCDKVRTKVTVGWNTVDKYVDSWVSSNFIVISGVNDRLKNLSDEDKKVLKKDLLLKFWVVYMYQYSNKLVINPDFFIISENDYEKARAYGEPFYKLEEVRDLGFFRFGGWGNITLSRSDDALDFLNYVLLNDEETLMSEYKAYPKIVKKYSIMRRSIEDVFDVNIDEMFNN